MCVGRLKDMDLALPGSDPLAAANVLEIFEHCLPSFAKSLFYIGSSLVPFPTR